MSSSSYQIFIFFFQLKPENHATAKSLQSCPTLWDSIDGSPPGSPTPGILQARTLEWVVISFSNAWKWKVKAKSLSHVRLLDTPWTAAYQAPLSMGFSRQEYWSGVPLPSPLETFLVVTTERWLLLASGGQRPWMMLNILQYTGQTHNTDIYSSKCKQCWDGETLV